jgi:hypothetical protein
MFLRERNRKVTVKAEVPNLAELVRALAEIASPTTDTDTAQRLMALAHQLMTDADAPPGSEPPTAAGPA